MAAHLCPLTAIGWKARASHPSKPCRATSKLAGRAYSAAGQAASARSQNKTHTFSKREQKSFSAYHKRPALMQPVCTAVSTCCHTGRGLAGHPGVSMWVMTTVRRGYTLQFARRPLRFCGVLATTVHSENAQVLCAEVNVWA